MGKKEKHPRKRKKIKENSGVKDAKVQREVGDFEAEGASTGIKTEEE